MNISGHISTLLKFNECVIIPEFGGFISNYEPAHFDHKNNVFFPPAKEVVFNSKINKNDGLLINQIVEAEGIGYHDARMAILNWVENTMKLLFSGEEISFEGVGTLKMDRKGSYVFNPGSENILIDAYGLKEINVQQISSVPHKEYHQPRPAVRVINNGANVAKIAAGITLLVTLSLFPSKKGNFDFQSSNVNPLTPITTEAATTTESISSKETIAAEVVEKAEQPAVKPYILVGGSFQYYENAHNFEIELRINGHHPEVFKQDNGLYKVAIDSYYDKQEALTAMKIFREDHPSIGAWVSRR